MSENNIQQQERQRKMQEQNIERERLRLEAAKQQELTRQATVAQQERMRAQQEMTRQTNARGWALFAATTFHSHNAEKADVLNTASEFVDLITSHTGITHRTKTARTNLPRLLNAICEM